MGLLHQLSAPSYRLRIVPNQNADEVFLLLNTPFDVGNRFSCAVDELLSLAHIKQRSCAMIGKELGQAQRVLPGGECLARDFQLQVEFPQLEISAGNIANERTDDLTLRPLLRQQA